MIPAVALGALVLGGPAEPAAASRAAVGPAAVSLAVEDCPAVPREPLARLLALELETPVLVPEQAGGDAVRVRVACAGATVRLTVDDPAKGIELRRVTEVPPQQEEVTIRLVALAIAESVLTSRVAGAFEKAPDARPAARLEETASAPPPANGAQPAGHAFLLAFGQALGPFTGLGVGWGGGLRFEWAFAPRWLKRPAAGLGLGPALDVELAAAESTADRALGTVQASLWSTTLRASLRLRAGRAWLDVGGGGRFGLAQLQGQPTDAAAARGAAVVGTWAGPVAYAGVGVRFWHTVIELGVEGGRVLRTVTGTVDGGAPVSIDGNWGCATVAAGWGQ
jgi:hypothetical protein